MGKNTKNRGALAKDGKNTKRIVKTVSFQLKLNNLKGESASIKGRERRRWTTEWFNSPHWDCPGKKS